MPTVTAMKSYCAQHSCDFGVMLGDNIYPDGAMADADDARALSRRVHDALRLAGRGATDFRIYGVLGNHDWHTSRDGALAQVRFLETTPPFFMNGLFYRVVPAAAHGEVEIFALDTQVLLAATKTPEAVLAEDASEVQTDDLEYFEPWAAPQTEAERNMVQWLEASLASSKARWKIVIGHHPLWSTAGSKFQQAKSLRRLILPALCRYADLYLAGHEHTLEVHTDGCTEALPGSDVTPLAAGRVGQRLEDAPDEQRIHSSAAQGASGAAHAVRARPDLGLRAFDIRRRPRDRAADRDAARRFGHSAGHLRALLHAAQLVGTGEHAMSSWDTLSAAARCRALRAGTGPVYNPATGETARQVSLASADETRAAIRAAHDAFPAWAATAPLQRARVMFRFKALLDAHAGELASIITSEHGKVLSDARGEVLRGTEVVEFACGIPHLLKGEFSDSVGAGIDSWSLRQPVGVCAGITPFNFPAMVPMWMFPLAIACGNTFVLKPSEKRSLLLIARRRVARRGGAAARVCSTSSTATAKPSTSCSRIRTSRPSASSARRRWPSTSMKRRRSTASACRRSAGQRITWW